MPDSTIPRDRRLAGARFLYGKTGGKGWEPPDPRHPLLVGLIQDGFLRRTDGICGFERLREACVAWTEAAHVALAPATETSGA